MTNEQLYLAVGLPIVFNLVFNGVLFLALNSRMTSLETRISGLETRLDSRIDALETRMSNLEQSTSAKFDLIIGALHDLGNRLSRLEDRFERK